MYYGACIMMEVILEDGYHGDYKSAIAHARRVAIKTESPVCLTYARQKYWIIYPETTMQEMNDMQNEEFVIGV